MGAEYLWRRDTVHIAGVIWKTLEDRGLEQSASTVLDELNRGTVIDGINARRALLKSEHDARPGDVWVLDPGAVGLYLVAPARSGQRKAWTVISWTALSAWGQRRALEAARLGVRHEAVC